MKKLTVLLLVLVALGLGYLLGTEQGRAQRDQIVARVRSRKGGLEAEDVLDLTEGADRATATAIASDVQ